MKTLRQFLVPFFLLLFALLGAGCGMLPGGDAAIIQRILDRLLPRTYVGDFHAHHKNTWIDFTIDATNLRHDGQQWVGDSLTWARNGRFSHGGFTFGPDSK